MASMKKGLDCLKGMLSSFLSASETLLKTLGSVSVATMLCNCCRICEVFI